MVDESVFDDPKLDYGLCHRIENGEQCQKPASIKIKIPAPEPYSDMMAVMWLCADHYDLWMQQTDNGKDPWGKSDQNVQ
jgi:hypothetical protein